MILTEACKNNWKLANIETILQNENQTNPPTDRPTNWERERKVSTHIDWKQKSVGLCFLVCGWVGVRVYSHSRFFAFSLRCTSLCFHRTFYSLFMFVCEPLLSIIMFFFFCSLSKKYYCKRRKNCNLINKFVIFVVFVSGITQVHARQLA